MKRQIIHIDETLCDGCGVCVPNCHEGALQIVDAKARLISDLFCDGLGACIGHCPQGAIQFEEREAEPYDERRVMLERIIPAGYNTIIAHLTHLMDHNEHEYVQQAREVLVEQGIVISPRAFGATGGSACSSHGGGCPGSQSIDFTQSAELSPSGAKESAVLAATGSKVTAGAAVASGASELRQWPVQMHLVSPSAGYFKNSDLLLAADCVAFAMGDFHDRFLKGKTLAIACPKLDSNKDVYIQKLIALINEAKVNTITVMIMEVPCCGGLMQIVQTATAQAARKVPVKAIVIGIRGNVLSEDWV